MKAGFLNDAGVGSRELPKFGTFIILVGLNVDDFCCTMVHVEELELKIFAGFFQILAYMDVRFPLTATIDGPRRRVFNSAFAEHLFPIP
jgi:hypothetical protein